MTFAHSVHGRRLAVLATLLCLICPTAAWPWGGQTHHYIAQNYSKHLPAVIDGLRAYDGVVDQKVNDPDIRRPYTPGEGPRHFMDIDWYAEFFNGTLPHDRAVLEAAYGPTLVLNNGIVPWAVGEVVTTLTQQFAAHQWSDAATTIADLCHYVGDATQPLHCTQNFDGQQTGNSGIHSRYETTMMSSHIADLHTATAPVVFYPNVVDAMFGIVTDSWNGVATVIGADNTAFAASGQTYNSVYYSSLWANTESLTRARIDAATLATASFVYTAWRNAGQPPVPGSSADVDPALSGVPRLDAWPLPFSRVLNVRFDGEGPLTIDVFDARGARVQRVVEGAAGAGSVSWTPPGRVEPGIYFLRLTTPQRTLVRRIARL